MKMKILLNTVLYVNLLNIVQGYLFVNQSEASKRCRENGELASYEYFDKLDKKLTLNVEQANGLALHDGESAWIKGYAKFSTFLSWYGCYSGKNKYFDVTVHAPDLDIYMCSNYCLENKKYLKYIALQRDKCICFTFVEFEEQKLDAYSDTQCQNLNDTSVDDMLMTELIKVYEIFKAEELFWRPAPAKLQQCVYATVRNNIFSYATHSCLTLSGIFIHGFICVNSRSSNLSERCSGYHSSVGDTPAACFVAETSSWIEARNRCNTFKGKLISDITRSLRGYAKQNWKYWTGIFRSFTMITLDHKQNYACLAVTRVNNALILDPDDCNVMKRFLCNDNLTNTHATTKKRNNTDLEITIWPEKGTASTEKSKEKGSETNKNIYVGTSLAVAVLLVTGVVIVAVYRLRKTRFGTQRNQLNEGRKD